MPVVDAGILIYVLLLIPSYICWAYALMPINNKSIVMTQKTYDFTWRLAMVLSVALSIALIIFLEVTA